VIEDWFRKLERELEGLREKGRLRSLRTYSGMNDRLLNDRPSNNPSSIDFGSNDYLGFAEDPKLKELAFESLRASALSSSSSRLLPGHHAAHAAAEAYFARFVGAEAALLFNSGYDANTALLTTLPTRHDLILYDDRSHASIYDGVHASLAKSKRFAHNSAADLRRILESIGQIFGQIFVVLESVYSMDGDIAEVEAIARVAHDYSAILMVDEAHATGVLGMRGEGLVKNTIGRNNSVLTVHTCGKALGAAGAFIAGSRTVVEYLINKARPFIYTTALPPLIPLQLISAIQRLESEGPELVTTLCERSYFLRTELKKSLHRWTVPEGRTPIISILIGADEHALRAARILERLGFQVPAIRPPTVPEGSARLRLNVSLRHHEGDLRRVIDAIVRTEAEMSN